MSIVDILAAVEEEEDSCLYRHEIHEIRERDPYRCLGEREFQKIFRFPKSFAERIIEKLIPELQAGRRCSRMAPHLRILAALHFYASGSYQAVIGNAAMNCISRSVVCRAVEEVTTALTGWSAQYIKFPQSEAEFVEEELGFRRVHSISEVIGVIDCTHVAIVKPHRNESIFVNRKGYHSVNVQIISQSNHRILGLFPNFPGSVHDCYIWRESEVQEFLRQKHGEGHIQFTLFGDSGYPLQPWLLTPIPNPPPNSSEARYNRKFKKVRSSVERTIGLLKGRFRCLLKDRTLHYQPEKACDIIVACAVLHNLAITASLYVDAVLDEVDGLPPQTSSIPLSDVATRRAGALARQRYVNTYFS